MSLIGAASSISIKPALCSSSAMETRHRHAPVRIRIARIGAQKGNFPIETSVQTTAGLVQSAQSLDGSSLNEDMLFSGALPRAEG